MPGASIFVCLHGRPNAVAQSRVDDGAADVAYTEAFEHGHLEILRAHAEWSRLGRAAVRDTHAVEERPRARLAFEEEARPAERHYLECKVRPVSTVGVGSRLGVSTGVQLEAWGLRHRARFRLGFEWQGSHRVESTARMVIDGRPLGRLELERRYRPTSPRISSRWRPYASTTAMCVCSSGASIVSSVSKPPPGPGAGSLRTAATMARSVSLQCVRCAVCAYTCSALRAYAVCGVPMPGVYIAAASVHIATCLS